MSIITVLLAEDHLIVLEGLKVLLSYEEEIEIIGEATDGHAAIELAERLQPDVVVMDVAMPRLNGLEATRQLLHRTPKTKVIILSAHNDDVYVKQALDFGASGYLLKQISGSALPEAIRQVHNGTSCFSQSVLQRLTHHRGKSRAGGSPHSKLEPPVLTLRETETLQLIAEGNTNKEAAAKMRISIKTVEKHRHKVMKKLHIHTTAHLTRYAIESGIIECGVQRTMKDCGQ
jgi:DNA-binding NarL/FixJ family response regulator